MKDRFVRYQDEVDTKVERLLEGYGLGVAAAALLGEDPPESPRAELRAIRKKACSDFLEVLIHPVGG